MELLTLLLFCGILLTSILLRISIIWALLGGLFLFAAYALKKGFQPRRVFEMCASGILSAQNILITMALIGVLTAVWRACGTIAEIICLTTPLLNPSIFLLMAFLLNCVVSFLTGTAFGTAATMGVICAAMGASLGIPVLFTGGAVLSGVFFGDRCSPVSTSMLLVAELTHTSPYENIPKMLRSSAVPFFLSCVFYLLLGFSGAVSGQIPDFQTLFRREFQLHPLLLLPAVVILTLSLLRVRVKYAMTASILSALPLALLFQRHTPVALLQIALSGFHASDPEVAVLMNGGGVLSMLRVLIIICISSAYAGIFRDTELLSGIRGFLYAAGKKTTPFGAVLLTSVFTSMIACNQTLATMLTDQLCRGMDDNDVFAIQLENSVILVAGLIPWSIAGGVPLSSIGAPSSSMLLACYLYFVPAWTLLCAVLRKNQTAA